MIPASAVTSLLCQGMLMDIVYVVSSKSHFGSMSSERQRESLVKLLGLSAEDG